MEESSESSSNQVSILARDPVCGMSVNPATGKHIYEHAGKKYYFCCSHCVEKFKADPPAYLNKPSAAGLVTLGMKSGQEPAVKPNFARDPVCGMDVNRGTAKFVSEQEGKKQYFCSRGCVQKFEGDPAKYLNKGSLELVELGAPAGTKSAEIADAQSQKPDAGSQAYYACPMCPEVRETKPVPCPSCGMALEPENPLPATRTEYTCPMHPEIVRREPGSCPICGMALEPRTVTAAEEENPEVRDMTRRFWVAAILTTPLVIFSMGSMFLTRLALPWIEFALATPVVVWCGFPFFQRFWTSVVNRSPNMFTLIGLGTGAAYLDSVVATLFPQIFPASFRDMHGAVSTYFEAAAVITTLVLLGQVLELRARQQTSGAIRALLNLAPQQAHLLVADGREQ